MENRENKQGAQHQRSRRMGLGHFSNEEGVGKQSLVNAKVQEVLKQSRIRRSAITLVTRRPRLLRRKRGGDAKGEVIQARARRNHTGDSKVGGPEVDGRGHRGRGRCRAATAKAEDERFAPGCNNLAAPSTRADPSPIRVAGSVGVQAQGALA